MHGTLQARPPVVPTFPFSGPTILSSWLTAVAPVMMWVDRDWLRLDQAPANLPGVSNPTLQADGPGGPVLCSQSSQCPYAN